MGFEKNVFNESTCWLYSVLTRFYRWISTWWQHLRQENGTILVMIWLTIMVKSALSFLKRSEWLKEFTQSKWSSGKQNTNVACPLKSYDMIIVSGLTLSLTICSYCLLQVLKTASSVYKELMYVSLCWSANTGMSMCWSP